MVNGRRLWHGISRTLGEPVSALPPGLNPRGGAGRGMERLPNHAFSMCIGLLICRACRSVAGERAEPLGSPAAHSRNAKAGP